MGLYVRSVKDKGRGVFTDQPIRKGAIVEVCPVIPLSAPDWKLIQDTVLRYHAFDWPDNPYGVSCITLGLGSIINHSENPNSEWTTQIKQRTITFRAVRDIKAGEEITHDYKWAPEMWED